MTKLTQHHSNCNPIQFNVKEGTETIEILQGKAQERLSPKTIHISGLITAPFDYLEKRINCIEQEKCNLIVNESDGYITLNIDEKNPYTDSITGRLKLNPDFKSFGINDGTQRDTFKLADFIRMNRFFFSDKVVAMKLISDLKNFKAKVNNKIEQSDNNRGNVRLLKDQVVQSNIPESFDITIPIFSGHDTQSFTVEINIDSQDFNCTLISPDAKDIIRDAKSRILFEQVDKIKQIAPKLAILQV